MYTRFLRRAPISVILSIADIVLQPTQQRTQNDLSLCCICCSSFVVSEGGANVTGEIVQEGEEADRRKDTGAKL